MAKIHQIRQCEPLQESVKEESVKESVKEVVVKKSKKK